MRAPAPDARPVALTVAGSDSGGGAGIEADLATMTARGVYGTAAITAITAQHTRGVERSFPLPVEEVVAQLEAVTDDFAVRAAKTGMLATTEIVEALAERAPEFDFPLVVDPVMVATSGDRLLEPAAERAYEDLIAAATVVTPNADEAEVLTGIAVEDRESALEAGEALCEWGVDAALVKGGHVPGETVRDLLVTAADALAFEHPRVDTEATHGSGCALSAAIAAELAKGSGLETAVDRATDFLARAVRYHYDVGRGPGAVNHAVDVRREAGTATTAETVSRVVDRLADRLDAEDAAALVPGGGTNLVGAPPFAESVDDLVAVEGRIARTVAGVRPNRGVRVGVADPLAPVLLAARDTRPDLRFAFGCRYDDRLERALEALRWSVGTYDRETETLERIDVNDEGVGDATVAVLDPAAVGREATAVLLETDADALLERILDLLAALEEDG